MLFAFCVNFPILTLCLNANRIATVYFQRLQRNEQAIRSIQQEVTIGVAVEMRLSS